MAMTLDRRFRSGGHATLPLSINHDRPCPALIDICWLWRDCQIIRADYWHARGCFQLPYAHTGWLAHARLVRLAFTRPVSEGTEQQSWGSRCNYNLLSRGVDVFSAGGSAPLIMLSCSISLPKSTISRPPRVPHQATAAPLRSGSISPLMSTSQ